ncbi:PqiC family protein [Fundidesulfovibrio butyratiphilus]
MSSPKRLSPRLAMCLLLVSLLASACGRSAPTHFYSLTEPQAAEKPRPAGPCLALGVGPVELPPYLERTQIVTRGQGNHMKLAEFDQWIEPVQANFTSALQDALAARICAEPMVGYPWPDDVTPDRRIAVRVRQFDGVLGQTAVLRADWSVADKEGKVLVWRTSTLSEPCASAEYSALVAAQSRLVARLADEMVKVLPGAGK